MTRLEFTVRLRNLILKREFGVPHETDMEHIRQVFPVDQEPIIEQMEKLWDAATLLGLHDAAEFIKFYIR